ncbi:O-antigen ligase family protein [Egicoccus sp. AB-alg2]|uniref:O-antigen ligase family protein n=1 Tax=Egicoccus sp. AB-alg2 TaxID=3242693 RepID=UPI00359EEE22
MPLNPVIVALVLALLPFLGLAGLSAMRRPVVLLATYAAIVPFGSSLAVPGIGGSFGTVSTILALLISGMLVVKLLLGGDRAPELPAPLPWWMLVVVAAMLTVAWSIDTSATMGGIVVLLSLLMLYVVASLVDVRPEGLITIGTASAVSGALVGVTALVQLATGTMATEPVTGVPRFALAGGGGETGDPNITAAGLMLPLSIAVFRAVERGRSRRSRSLYSLGAGLTVTAILLTGSRGGILGLMAITGVLLLAEPARRPSPRHVLIGLLVVSALFTLTPTNVQERLQDASSTGRTDIWRIGLAACDDYCLLGSGWATFRQVHARGLLESPDRIGWVFGYDPHNVWLQMLVQAGVLALVLFTGALVVSYRALRRVPAAWRGPPMAALTALLAANIFVSNFDFKYFWLTLLYVNLSLTASGYLRNGAVQGLPRESHALVGG